MVHATSAPHSAQGTLSAQRARTADGIVHAAMGIIATDGIAGLNMSALADAAGVSRQTLYKYFPDVDAVLAGMAAVGSDGIAELADRLDTLDEPREALRALVAAVLEAAAAGHPSPLVLAAAIPPSAREAVRDHERATEALVIGLLRRGCTSGAFRADLDPELDGRFIYRATLAAHDLVLEAGVDVASLIERVATDLLRMVQVEPRPESHRR